MNVKQLLGARIKELRNKKGLTQEAFADLVNLAPRHISRIENGINTPSVEALDRIAGALDVPIKELYNFQYFNDEKYLKNDIAKILEKLDKNGLILAHKILNSILR